MTKTSHQWEHPQWSENEAAQYLHLSPKTLRKWRSLGKGPVYSKLGRAIRYERQDLDAYAQAQRKVPGSVLPKAQAVSA